MSIAKVGQIISASFVVFLLWLLQKKDYEKNKLNLTHLINLMAKKSKDWFSFATFPAFFYYQTPSAFIAIVGKVEYNYFSWKLDVKYKKQQIINIGWTKHKIVFNSSLCEILFCSKVVWVCALNLYRCLSFKLTFHFQNELHFVSHDCFKHATNQISQNNLTIIYKVSQLWAKTAKFRQNLALKSINQSIGLKRLSWLAFLSGLWKLRQNGNQFTTE